jgi:hypothetical protein
MTPDDTPHTSDPSDPSDPPKPPEPAEPPEPFISVVAGCPTPEELAVVVAVVQAASRKEGRGGDREQISTAWSAPVARMRPVVRRGPGAWRRSALPH